jgi:penicillin-binding protein 1A
MALGSASVPPLTMARGYATFANGGFLIEPYFIDHVTDVSGHMVFQAHPLRVCPECEENPEAKPELAANESGQERPEYRPLGLPDEQEDPVEPSAQIPGQRKADAFAPQVITPQNAYLVRSMMMDVVKRGTGKRAMELGRSDLAGKTGTTNDQRDAWFSGYNDALVTSVWVGFDDHEPLGRLEVGGRAALPVWIEFMRVALEGVPDVPPEMPEGLAEARINPETGLLAMLDNDNAIVELFEAGNLPPMEQAADGVDPDAAPEEDPYEIY